MKKVTILLLFLGLMLSVNTQAQIPTVLTDADFTTKTGVFRDSRDGKYYAYKKYGNEDWFMQNINYQGDGSIGLAGPSDLDGSMYGRFYKANTVSAVCPEGWKSPSTPQWGELINTIAKEYSIDSKSMYAAATNYYDLHMAMHYMRGGGLKTVANTDGLWLSGTGTEDEKSKTIQFNILPTGSFNGANYVKDHGIGQRMFFIATGFDRYQNHTVGGVNPGAVGRNTLKHHRVTTTGTKATAYGVVRCVRVAETMKDQVVIAEEITPKAVVDGFFDLVAIATSGLALTYASSDESVATVEETGKVTILAAGETTITISQLGDDEFNPAYTESRVLSVASHKAQTMDFVAIPSMTVGDADFALQATSTSGLPITYTSSNENVITIVIEETKTFSTTYAARVVGVGTTTITATQAGDAEYAAITSTQEITVIDGTVGIEMGSDATTLRVYANAQTIYVDATAVSDKFLGNTTIDVYNTLGAKLNTVKAKDAVTPITISTSGVYIIKVLSDGYKQEFKVIVK